MRRFRFLVVFAGLLGACATGGKPQAPAAQSQRITDLAPTVLLISLDGFRPDYLLNTQAPHLQSLIEGGVTARRMLPVFPSLTFPNHYSIVTGRYPDGHGIVANTFHDPKTGKLFRLGSSIVDEAHWWVAEPVWVTARKQGLKTASMYWVGSGAEERHPDYWLPYKKSFPAESRVDQVLAWLDLPKEERPTFITLYFEEVDTVGHESGPASSEVLEAVRNVDRVLGMLLRGLEDRGVLSQINLLVVSDHGMATVGPESYVFLDQYVDLSKAEWVGAGAVMHVWPKPGQEAGLLKELSKAHPRMSAYRKGRLPRVMRYGKSDRVGPIVLVADEGWFIATSKQKLSNPPKGMHGYDHRLLSMGALFVAHGPAFKRGVVIQDFSSVDLYPALARLLGIRPEPNDGNLNSFKRAWAAQ